MSLIERLKRSATDRQRLQSRYRRLSDAVGLVAGLIGGILLVTVMHQARLYLGLPHRGSIEGLETEFFIWAGLWVVAIPTVFYLSAVAVVWSFWALMAKLGHLTPEQARRYALYSEYPAHWFRPRDAQQAVPADGPASRARR